MAARCIRPLTCALVLVGVLALSGAQTLAEMFPVVSMASLTYTGQLPNDHSDASATSPDGRYVVFESRSQNLVPGSADGRAQIYLRDRAQRQTLLISANDSGDFAASDCFAPAMSDDARYVAFHSAAGNLIPNDNNSRLDVFVRDRPLGTTVSVSVRTDGTQGDDDSLLADVSANGRFVAFQSRASTLLGPGQDDNGKWDIFVRDRDVDADGFFDESGAVKTVRVSVSGSGGQSDGDSFRPSISDDGRYVVFDSVADNLVVADSNLKSDVFIHDRDADGDGLFDEAGAISTECISLARSGFADDDCLDGVISGDARLVAFQSLATNLLFLFDDLNAGWDVYVRNRSTWTLSLASVSTLGQPGNGDSTTPRLSSDGRYVVFSSTAHDLVAGDTNANTDVFIRDRQAPANTRRVSVTGLGEQSIDGDSLLPSISADGRFVTFSSPAGNLVPEDTNTKRDVFLYDMLGGVSLTKSAQPLFDASGPLTYTIVVSNANPAPQATLVVTDRVPAFTSYAENSMESDPVFGAEEGAPDIGPGSIMTWTIPGLSGSGGPSSAVTLTFAVRATTPITDWTPIVNLARMGDLSSVVTSTVRSAPHLTLGKDVSPIVVDGGGLLSYTIRLTNTGTGIGTGLVVTDAVPTNTRYIAGSMSATPAGQASWFPPLSAGAGEIMTWTIPSLARGITLTYRCQVDRPIRDDTQITNTAWLSGSFASAVVVVDAAPDVHINKTAYPAVVDGGGWLTYTIEVTNSGSGIALGLLVTDAVPISTQFDPGSMWIEPSGIGSTAEPAGVGPGGIITWTIDSLAAQSVTLGFRVKVDRPITDGLSIVNTAYAWGRAAVATTTVDSEAQLTLGKSVWPGIVPAGGILSYTIQVANEGSGIATNAAVTDSIPALTEYIPGSMEAVPADRVQTEPPASLGPGSTLTWTLEAVGAEPVVLHFDARVDKPLISGTVIANLAWMAGDSASAHATVSGLPALSVSARAAPNPVAEGEAITYTVLVTNSGNGIAQGAVITLDLPGSAFGGMLDGAMPVATAPLYWTAQTIAVTSSLCFTATAPGSPGTFENLVWAACPGTPIATDRELLQVVPSTKTVHIPLVVKDNCEQPDLDGYEPNQHYQEATPLTDNSIIRANFSVCSEPEDAVDEYRFSSLGYPITADLSGVPAGSDYDVYLYRLVQSSWVMVAKSERTGQANEHIAYRPTGVGEYIVQVWARMRGPLSAINWYTLPVTFR